MSATSASPSPHGLAAPRRRDMARMRQMTAIYNTLKDHWKSSFYYAEQVEFIRTKILTAHNLEIDSVACVGIGRLSNRNPTPSETRTANRWARGQKWELNTLYDQKSLKGLCQLILFECWVEVLRERFTIDKVSTYFYFPHGLNRVERLFMEGQDYEDNVCWYYHDFKHHVTTKTFVFITSKHAKHWHEIWLTHLVPTLAVLAPLQVNGYWKNYSRDTQRVFRRFLNTVHSRKLGPLIDTASLRPSEQKGLIRGSDTKNSTELRMSDILLNYEWYWRPDQDLTAEREKPMYGWYTPMAWHKLPGPTGVSGEIYDLSEMREKWRAHNVSWWQWLIKKLPWLAYFDIILRWIKEVFINAFWPGYLPLAGGQRWPVEAVWDSREEGERVWYLVETRSKNGTAWGHWLSEDLGSEAYTKVIDFHFASPGKRMGNVPKGWWDYGKELLFGDPYLDLNVKNK